MGAVILYGVPCWALPLSAGVVWLATLISMLIVWASEGSDHYPEMYIKQEWPYISNTGATTWGRPVFVTGSAVMIILWSSSLALERWLRDHGRLLHYKTTWTTTLFIASTSFTAIGSIALLLLSIFDIRQHPRIHYPCVAIFLFGYLLAAASACIERKLLSRHFASNRILRFSFRVKLIFVAVEVALVCLFAATMYQKVYGWSVVVEWMVAFFFAFYMCTFAWDFYSVPRKRGRDMERVRREWEAEEGVELPRAPGRVRFVGERYVELP